MADVPNVDRDCPSFLGGDDTVGRALAQVRTIARSSQAQSQSLAMCDVDACNSPDTIPIVY